MLLCSFFGVSSVDNKDVVVHGVVVVVVAADVVVDTPDIAVAFVAVAPEYIVIAVVLFFWLSVRLMVIILLLF